MKISVQISKKSNLLTIGVLLLSAVAPTYAQWIPQAYVEPLTQARRNLAAASVDSKAFFAGGFIGNSNYSNVIDIYDNSNDSWSTYQLSSPRESLSGASVGNKVLFAGGGATFQTKGVDIYDNSNNNWSYEERLFTARAQMSAVTAGNKVFFAGGEEYGPVVSSVVDVYDDNTGNWTHTNLSQARAYMGGATAGGKVFFAGGWSGSSHSNVVDIFDAATGNFIQSITLPTARDRLSGAAVGTKVLFAGGNSPGGFTNVIEIYDTNTGQWTTKNLSQARGYMAAVTIGNKVFFAGGLTTGNLSSNVVDIYDNSTGNVTSTTLSQTRFGLAAAVVGTKIIIGGGGITNTTYSAVVDIYDTETTPPTVTAYSPADNATTVAADANISLTFNEKIKKGTGNIIIKEGGVNKQTIAVSNGTLDATNKTITFDPSDFTEGADVNIEIASGVIKDLPGNNYAGISSATTWNFKAAATPPSITDNTTATTVNQGEPITISATITDGESAITAANVIFRSVTEGSNTELRIMTPSGDTYTATIDASEIGELGIEYKITATSLGGTKTSDSFKQVKIQSSGLTIPYAAFGATQSNYRIVSVPLDLTSKSVSSVFNELGEANKEEWRMYHYDGSTKELTPSSQLVPGKGYWLIVRTDPGESINSGAGVSVTATPDYPFKIQLKADWNQIGNPYNFNISWADVQAANPGLPGLRIFDGAMKDGSQLNKMQGGFVKVTTAQEIVIPVSKNGDINSGRVQSEPNPFQRELTDPNWQVKLLIQQEDMLNEISGFGMHEHASTTFDRYDGFNMPPFFDRYLELNHKKKDGGDFYSKDIVPTADEHIWEFSIASTSDKKPIKLTWDNSYFGDNDKELYLWDERNQLSVNMKLTNSYVFEKNEASSFRVIFGSSDFVRDKVMAERFILHSVWPNPSPGDFSIAFSVPESMADQDIEFSVTDLLGREVHYANVEARAGYNEFSWNKNAGITSGIYSIILKAGAMRKQERVIIK